MYGNDIQSPAQIGGKVPVAHSFDDVDLQTLYYLDIDSRRPVKQIASLLGEKSEKINYRLGRLFRDGVIRRCFAEVNPWKVGYTSFKVYLQFQGVDRAKIEEMYSFLTGSCNLSWAASCMGRWDMIIEILAKDRHEFIDIYSRFHRKYCDYILCRVVGVTLEMVFMNKKWLCPGKPSVSMSVMTGHPERHTDAKDLEILRLLTRDCRAPVKTMAQKLGMPPTTLSQRMNNLVKHGVTPAFCIDLDLARFGRVYCKSFVYFSHGGEDEVKKLMECCAHHPDVVFMTRCIAPWDLEIEAHASSFNEFTAMMNDLRNRFPGVVRNFETVVINKETGSFYAFPTITP